MPFWGSNPDDEDTVVVNTGILNLGGSLVIDGQTVCGDGAVIYVDDDDD